MPFKWVTMKHNKNLITTTTEDNFFITCHISYVYYEIWDSWEEGRERGKYHCIWNGINNSVFTWPIFNVNCSLSLYGGVGEKWSQPNNFSGMYSPHHSSELVKKLCKDLVMTLNTRKDTLSSVTFNRRNHIFTLVSYQPCYFLLKSKSCSFKISLKMSPVFLHLSFDEFCVVHINFFTLLSLRMFFMDKYVRQIHVMAVDCRISWEVPT